ncbi:hypothetical protein C442_18584 [Haloarcula amylolytica JCM 13557]|uniref:Uncharacterized protein n=1 Tax=Haloarcula amylolytica JCM 13557 TaxID=1227452 RepID=M0K3G9_9EURY|nr:hypothetical protein C442_18584 [Haloarcula amylolytica JCM 13557]
MKTCLLSSGGVDDVFTIERSPDEDTDWSYIETLRDYVSIDDIEMIAYGYSIGDNLDTVTDITATENRGIVDTCGLGHEFGTGTLVYDELKQSDIPTTVFPGVHDGLETVHPYFCHYSPLAGADKFATARYAQEMVTNSGLGSSVEGETFIAANVSSSSMATYVDDGEIRGAFHWMGLIHGWGDIECLRQIRDGEQNIHDAFMKSGLLYRSDYDFEDIKGVPCADLLEMVYYATLHNVYSLIPFAEHHGTGLDAIVLSGRLSRVKEPFDIQDRLTEALSSIALVHTCQELSTALGAAFVARDVARGNPSTLGVPIEFDASNVTKGATATDD